MNQFFSTIGDKLRANFCEAPDNIKLPKVLNTLYLQETTECEIFQLITQLQTKNSEDEYGISVRFLKLLSSAVRNCCKSYKLFD